jgi:hypothetical protein
METHPDEFNDLRKLLALKRHEQPPPRYFNEFSGRVIDAICTPELLPQPTWWQRLGRLDWNFRPATVCGLGVVMSALLLVGAVKSVQVETPQMAGAAPMEVGEVTWIGAPVMASIAHHPISSLDQVPPSTSPVFSAPASSPFSHLAVQASRVNWTLGRAQDF